MWLVLEMLDQGMPKPLFVQSGLDGQGLDAVAARVAEFGGTPAGDHYDGALVVDAAKTIGGGGRSNPEVTMVGGKAPEHLADALEQARAAAHAG